MDQLTQQAIEFVLGLSGPVVWGLVGFFTWAEAAFFLGLVTPGEIAMALGGALATRGQVALSGVAVAAAVGTVTGNITGYWLGRRWGRLLDWPPLQRLLGRSIDTSRDFLARRGEWAVVLGQFVSYVRIFVPFLAGASGMPFRRYLTYGVPTAVVWAVAWVLGGYVLGESWRMLQDMAGPAAFLVLVLVLLGLAIRWAAVWVARRRDRVEEAARWVGRRAPALWLRRHFGTQLRWMGERFDPRVARGLNLTLGFLVLLLGVGVGGVVLAQVEQVQGIARLDYPVLEWMAATRTEEAVQVARVMLQPFVVPGFVVLAVVLAAGARWRSGWMAATRGAVGILGTGVGAYLLDRHALHGVVPRAGFPSVPLAVAASLGVHATAVVGARNAWGPTVATAAAGIFLTCAVGMATLVAGWAAPSGIALGVGLGLTWSTSVELSVQIP